MMTGPFIRLFTAWMLLCANVLILAQPIAAASESSIALAATTITVGAGAYTCTEAGLNQAVTDIAAGGTINFSCPGSSITLTQPVNLGKGLTIDGTNTPYTQMTLSGGNTTRLFVVAAGVSVTLQKLSLVNGNGTGGDGTGGAIANNGTLALNNTQLSSNTATFGAAIVNNGGASLTLNNSLVSSNTADFAGAVWNAGGGTMTINASTFENNQATDNTGGAIENDGALTVTNSTFYSNTAGLGPSAGAIYAYSSGPTTVTNTTFVGNTAGTGGAGSIWADSGTIAIGNSIISGGTPANCGATSSSGVLSSQGYNLVSGASCGFGATGDRTAPNPQLGSLQNNGGATPTFLPLSGSPVLDAIPAARCPSIDQRGIGRPQGSACDTGAVEAIFTLSFTKNAPASVNAGASLTYTIGYSYSGEVNAQTVVMTDPLPSGVTYQGVASSAGSCSQAGGVVTCNLGNLSGAGSSGTITISTNAPSTIGTSINTAYLSWQGGSTSKQATTSVQGTPPSITQQPQNRTIVIGQSATLRVTADGYPTPTYQWYQGVSGDTSHPIGGATSASYITTPVASGVYNFWVRVSNSAGNLDSATATVTVNPASTTTTLTSAPNPSVYGQLVTITATVSVVAPGAGTPTGSVQFYAGNTPLGSPVTLAAGGTATLSTAALVAGMQPISATYSGDANFSSSSGTLPTQTVNQAATSTSLASAPNPSTYGQAVVVTATVSAVAPGSGVPDGTVQFYTDGVVNGSPVTLDGSGRASITLASLPTGSHSISATYSGGANFTASSDVLTQSVNALNTTTTVSSSQNPSTYSQSVTFTAEVTSTSGIPDGSVVFYIDGSATGSPVTLDAAGKAKFSTATLSAGSHTITVTYSGSANYAPGNSAPLTQNVQQASTTVALVASPNPSTYGQIVTFTVTVTSSAGTPTGSVQFSIDGNPVGNPVSLDSSGQATYGTAGLTAGNHSIAANYTGSTNYASSSSSLPVQVVTAAATTLTLTSEPNPAIFGQTVAVTATVAVVAPGVGTPDGSVQFFVDGNPSGSPVTLDAAGQASILLSSLPAGTYSITATYHGSTNFAASNSGLTQQVQPAGTSTSLASEPNPSTIGQSVAFTATVASPTGVPTGTVNFFADGMLIGNGTLNGGQASIAYSALATGSHPITATYAGGANYEGSTSQQLIQVVNAISTTTDLSVAPNPSLAGNAVTFTATVTASSGTPTGTVQFYIDGASFGNPVTLNGGGEAATTTTSLLVGSHTITATYSGSAVYASSTSLPVTQVVNTIGVALSPTSAMQMAQPNMTVEYIMTVTNTGTLSDSYSIALGSHSFTTTLSAATVGPLAPGESATIVVSVTVPFSTNPYNKDTVTVTVQSNSDPNRSAASVLTTKQAWAMFMIVARGATSGW